AKIQTAVVVDRVTKVHPTAIDVRAVFSHVFLLVVGFPVIHVKAATDPIHGVVWVQIREAGTLHRFTAVNTKRHPAATAQEVIFTDVGPHDDPAALGKAETGGQGTGGLLFNAVIHVHLVVHARDRGGLDIHFLKEAQALQTGLGGFDGVGGGHATFHLPHFLTQHFVTGGNITP